MRLLTWNVNGIRAVMKKGLEQILDLIDADIVCLQETKCQPDQIELSKDLYPYQYANSAVRKGYSGTLIASRYEPLSVRYGMEQEEFDQEGRVITAEFPDFFLVTVYTPNSGAGLKRLEFRKAWDAAFASWLAALDKPFVVCGDLNVARNALDIWDEKDGLNMAGYTDTERNDFETLLTPIAVDVYRELHPDTRGYTWWSYQSRGRQRNAGWRIDYWLTSPVLLSKVREIEILDDVFGSDHCPVLMDIDLQG